MRSTRDPVRLTRDLLETCRHNKGAGSLCMAYVIGSVDTEMNSAGYQGRPPVETHGWDVPRPRVAVVPPGGTSRA